MLDQVPDVIYAIGDVHGCLQQLVQLEDRIVADAAGAAGDRLIIMLGDLVDRGPDSAGVIDHMMRPPPAGFARLCLMGNHEAAMLEFLGRPRRGDGWLEFGGVETLLSYGLSLEQIQTASVSARQFRRLIETYLPDEHVQFLDALPLTIETPEAIFVHAGLRPGLPLGDQPETDLLWYRDDFSADYAEFGKVVVHGHSIVEEPLVAPYRIAIDTGCFATGRLTAVKLQSGRPPELIGVGPNEVVP